MSADKNSNFKPSLLVIKMTITVLCIALLVAGVGIWQLVTLSEMALSEVSQGRTSGIVLIILAVIAAVSLGLVPAILLNRSISRVRDSAERIAGGDFTHMLEVQSHDEIGRLTYSFNMMAERLRESYARLALARQRDAALIESLSEGLIATEANGTVISLNQAAIRMLDLPDGIQAIGKPVEDVLVLRHKDNSSLIVAIHERPETKAFAIGRPVSDSFSYIKQSGETINIDVSASPIIFEGKNTGAVMVIRGPEA